MLLLSLTVGSILLSLAYFKEKFTKCSKIAGTSNGGPCMVLKIRKIYQC